MAEQLRRWWIRFGFWLVLAGLALGVGWWIRQTQGGLVAETFGVLVAPLSGSVAPRVVPDEQRVQLLDRFTILEEENRKLRALLDLQDPVGPMPVSAKVIGRSADHWWQQILLNRGDQDGIPVGSVVVAATGVVGKVIQTTPHTSRVLLLSDPSSQVGVITVKSRVMGILQGRRRGAATVEFFEQRPIKLGELLTTSGLSSRFPAGLVVGKVVRYDRNQSAPKAEVIFSAPLGSLEWVKIYPDVPAEPGGAVDPEPADAQSLR